MKKIIIKMPTSLAEIKIGHLQELYKLQGIYTDPFEQRLQKIAYLSRTPVDILKEYPKAEIDAIDLSWLNTSEIKSDKLYETFTIKGVKYMRDDLGKETASLHLDFSHFAKNPVENAHLLLAMIFRPAKKIFRLGQKPTFEIEKYTTKGLSERANIFRNNLPANIFESLLGFFLVLQENTLRRMLESLENLMPKVPEGEKKEEMRKKMQEITSFLNT